MHYLRHFTLLLVCLAGSPAALAGGQSASISETKSASAKLAPSKTVPSQLVGVRVAAPSPGAPKESNTCARLSARLPGISAAMCQDSALIQTGAKSRNGFPILARQIVPGRKPAAGKEPLRVLLLGGIHGDELSASAAVFRWMQWMQQSQASNMHWNVIPVLNPDGLLASKPRRVNANGVDLNRNFPSLDGHADANRYWVTRTGSDPRRFPGKSALSEPESRWVSEEIKRFQPQLVISVHAPFGLLDFDGKATPPQRFGALRFHAIGVYPGSLGNYSGLRMHVPVLTIELPNARSMPSDAELARIWRDMLAWIERNIGQPAPGAALAFDAPSTPVASF